MTRTEFATGTMVFIAVVAVGLLSVKYVDRYVGTAEARQTPSGYQGSCLHEDSSGENWSWTRVPNCKSDETPKDSPLVSALASSKTGAPTDEMSSMISGFLGEIDDRWSEIFQASGQTFTGPRLVLFRNATKGGRCGMPQATMGPFYCAPDKTIFLDPGYFRQMETLLHVCSGNACKFTAAYIIAREAGHHVQNLLGILPRVTRLQQQAASKAEANALQSKVELQADCLSGVWVNREEKKWPDFLEAGDIDAVLAMATALGDDTLQRQATGRVVPDSFTHGSAAQRRQWFTTGYQQGTLEACNTFAAGAM